jgi:ABC-type multidrug transport system ATPase subunit/ABC-type transporter Mla maintaining outer membrane lipid asymmetry permease subunit MlaE
VSAPAVIEAEDLSIVAGGRTLVAGASFTIRRGEVVLLAGPSGSGKSTLLGFLAGILRAGSGGPEVRGALCVLGRDVLRKPKAARGRVGIVFQDHALFSGLTAARNLSFALDHRRPPLDAAARAAAREEMLRDFGIPGDVKVEALSGGQRQRVAVARALAFTPEVLAYDEPTSGLDPAMRDRVARLIREKGEGTTRLVVTHDVAGLAAIADRVLLIDPATATLREVVPAEAARALAALEPPPVAGPAERGKRRLLARLAGPLAGTGGALLGLLSSVLHLVPVWRSPRWGGRFLLRYLRTVAGPGALLYFLLAGGVIGLVTTFFTFTFLPWRQYTEPLILDDFMAGAGYGLFRILVPLILTILLAARAGAALSADVATRVVGRQTDAMRSFGAEPSRYLLTGALLAFLLGTPLIGFLGFVGARAASAGVFAVMAPDQSLHAWSGMFDRFLHTGSVLPEGWGFVLAKELCAAFGTAAIAYHEGARPKRSPEEVANAITRTVIRATVLTLAIHTAFALFEF